MSYTGIAYRLPRPLRRHILHFESEIEDAVAAFARALPAGRACWMRARARGSTGITSRASAIAESISRWATRRGITAGSMRSPISRRCPSARGPSTPRCTLSPSSICARPGRALAEIARTLVPGGALLIAAPHEWEVHQAPHDYFRYTRYGLAYLLEKAGFEVREMRAAGGYFRLLARRLLNGLQFFTGGVRWLLFLPAAILLVPPALILPLAGRSRPGP